MGVSERRLQFIMRMRDRVSAVNSRIAASFQRVSRAVGTFTGRIKLARFQMLALRRTATLMVSAIAALGGGFIAFTAIQLMSDFGDRMSAVEAVTGATALQFEQLRDQAILMGNTTRFTAGEAASALEELARAGMSVSEALGSVDSALSLAAAGALDLGMSADIITNIMSAFKLETADAARVADVLAVTAANSNTDVTQLANAFVYAGGTAGQFGASLEETAAAMGVLANFGRKASVAGSGVNTMLALMARGGKPLQTALARVNMTSADLIATLEDDGPNGGLIGALEALERAGVDSTEGMVIFGTRAGPTFNVLRDNLPMLRNFEEMLRTTEQSAKDIAFTMDDNLGGSLRRLKAAFQGFVLSANQDQEGGLRSFTEMLALTTRYITDGEKGMDAIKETIEQLGWNVERTSDQVRKFAAVLKVVVSALAGLAAVVAIGASVIVLAGAFAALGTVVGALVGGAAALAAMFGLFHDEIVSSGDAVTTWGDIAVVVFGDITNAVRWAFGKIGDAFQWLGGAFSQTGEAASIWGGRFGNILKAIANVAIAVTKTFIDVFITAFRIVLQSGKAFAEELAGVITGPIEALALTAQGKFSEAKDALDSATIDFNRIGGTAASEFERGYKTIANNFDTDFVGNLTDAVAQEFAAIGIKIENYAGSVVERAAEKTTARFVKAANKALDQTGDFGEQLDLARRQMDMANELGNDELIALAETNLVAIEARTEEIAGIRADLLQAIADGDREAMERLGVDLTTVYSEVVSATEKFSKQAFAGFTEGGEEVEKALTAAELSLQTFKDKISDTIAQLRAQAAAFELTAEQQRLYSAAASAGIDVVTLQKKVQEALGDEYSRFSDLTMEQIKAMQLSAKEYASLVGLKEMDLAVQELMAAEAKNRIRDLGIEQELLEQLNGLSVVETAERAGQVAVYEAVAAAKKQNLILSAEELEATRRLAETEFQANNRRMTFMEALRGRIQTVQDATEGFGEALANNIGGAVDQLAGAFAEFFTGQEVQWGQLTATILSSIAQMIIKFLILLSVMQLMNFIVPGSGTAMANLMGNSGMSFFADGAAFDKGSRIVNSPTAVRFRNRQGDTSMGTMGEAGPEAIMPLARGPGGKLGVVSVGGGGGGSGGPVNNIFSPHTEIKIESSGDPAADKQAALDAAKLFDQILEKRQQDFAIQQARTGRRLNG